MGQFYQQQNAKEDFKKLIVKTIEDGKNFFSNIEHNKFINSVTMLDCLMDSYKDDPEFIQRANVLNQQFGLKKQEIESLEIQGFDVNLNEQQKQFFIEWFRLLIRLATRTVFAGRLTDVDIDLNDVMKEWKAMTQLDDSALKSNILNKSMTDTREEPDGG